MQCSITLYKNTLLWFCRLGNNVKPERNESDAHMIPWVNEIQHSWQKLTNAEKRFRMLAI